MHQTQALTQTEPRSKPKYLLRVHFNGYVRPSPRMSSRVSGQASPSKLIQIQNEALKDGIGMEKVAPNLCNLVWQDASKKTAFHEMYLSDSSRLLLNLSASVGGKSFPNKFSSFVLAMIFSHRISSTLKQMVLLASPFTRNMAHISDDRQTRIPLTNNALRN